MKKNYPKTLDFKTFKNDRIRENDRKSFKDTGFLFRFADFRFRKNYRKSSTNSFGGHSTEELSTKTS